VYTQSALILMMVGTNTAFFTYLEQGKSTQIGLYGCKQRY